MVLDGDDVRLPPVSAGAENTPVRHLTLVFAKIAQTDHFGVGRMIFSSVWAVSSSGKVQVPDRRTSVEGDGGSTNISFGDPGASWDSETDSVRLASVAVKWMSRVPEKCKSIYFNFTDISNSGQMVNFGKLVIFFDFFLKIS